MNDLTFILLIIIIVGLLSIIYANYYNAFHKYLIKINEVESKIDVCLRKRFDLLNKASSFIKEHLKESIMEELSEIKTDQLSSFELERKLISITKEFYNIRLTNKKLVKMEEFTILDFELRENEAELEGFTTYYNDSISKFNRLVRMFPSNIVAKTSRFKEKTFYDGKNMSDEDINDFKL